MPASFEFFAFWIGYFIWLTSAMYAVYESQDYELAPLARRTWTAVAVLLCIAPFVAIGMS